MTRRINVSYGVHKQTWRARAPKILLRFWFLRLRRLQSNFVSYAIERRRLPLRSTVRLLRHDVFVDRATLHNDDKVLVWVCNKLDIFQRIAVDEQ